MTGATLARRFERSGSGRGDAANKYGVLYKRSDGRYRSTGRDLWIFQKDGEAWIAVWRTMLDVEEHAV